MVMINDILIQIRDALFVISVYYAIAIAIGFGFGAYWLTVLYGRIIDDIKKSKIAKKDKR